MESEKFVKNIENANFKANKESTGKYKVIGIRQEQAPGSFTGFGLYYPVLKSEGFSANVINEDKGFDPGLSYRNIPTQLLFEQGIDATREDEVNQIVDLLNKKQFEKPINEYDIVARYAKEFVAALENIGVEDLKFDYVTSKAKDSLKVMNEVDYFKLAEKYDKKARKILLNELTATRFSVFTDEMSAAASVIAGNRAKLNRDNMTLYNIFVLHSLDFDQAVRYMSINRLFLSQSLKEVQKTLLERYSKIKHYGNTEDNQDDIARFKYLLDIVGKEVIEREEGIAEKISKMRSADNLTTN